ncbi:MAG: class I SAM-dependent methyltransferase [Actinomycetota bacterium]|nr:class I SAM-dependent methyltransferase [Actinomycetota bacterium]
MANQAWLLDELGHAGRENLDPVHVANYDEKEDAKATEEVRLLAAAGVLTDDATVIDLGAGTGQFTLAVAPRCARVVAVDVSPVMLKHLHRKVGQTPLGNVECVHAGFLSYEHQGRAADLIYSRLALHHLPDAWKAVALCRMADMLHPGGALRLSDVVYGFAPQSAGEHFDAWMQQYPVTDPDGGWTRADVAEHIRDEHSTFTWLLEPMIERAGFQISEAHTDAAGIFAHYLCTKL